MTYIRNIMRPSQQQPSCCIDSLRDSGVTFPCVGVHVMCVVGSVPSVVAVNKRSVPVSWCDEHAHVFTISNVSRAFSVTSNSPPEKSCTCSTRTDSSAKTTISPSSKVTRGVSRDFLITLRYVGYTVADAAA